MSVPSRQIRARYCADEWIVAINDITPTVRRIHALLEAGDDQAAAARLPAERTYPLPERLRTRIGADHLANLTGPEPAEPEPPR